MATIAASTPETANVARMLDMLAMSEATSTSRLTKHDGYDVIVSGVSGPEIFTDFSQHPFTHRNAKVITTRAPWSVEKPLLSSASGRYQMIFRTWQSYQNLLHLPDFSPLSQDLACIRIIQDCGALDLVRAGEVAKAVPLCAFQWASLPGNSAGQNPHSMDRIMQFWDAALPVPMDASIPQEMQ